MNASHAALSPEVFSISEGCLDSPVTSTTSSNTTPGRRTTMKKVRDANKQKIAASILERNEKMKESAIVQKDKEEVQNKKAKHDYDESLHNTFEELEDLIFETKMEVRTIERDISSTTDGNKLSDFNARKDHLSNKLIRNEKRMVVLKKKMGTSSSNNNN